MFSVTRGNNFGLVSSWFFVVLLNKLSNEQLSCLLFVIPWRSSDQVTFVYSALNSPVYIEPVMVWCHSEGKKQLNQCWPRYGTPDKCHQRLMSYSNLQSHSVVCLYTSIWEEGQGKAPSLNSFVPGRSGCNLKNYDFQLYLLICTFRSWISLKLAPKGPIDNDPALV